MSDILILSHGVVLLVGWFIGSELWQNRRAKEDSICPVCLGPTDDNGTWKTDDE